MKPVLKFFFRGALCLMLVLLGACRSELFTGMAEADCNEALAVLLSAGIAAEKKSADDGKTWTLRVPEDRIVGSLDLLRERGLPRAHFANLGDLFKKDGLISTPVEERVRFVYGVSQELSETLSRMDGVVVARVHIVLPNNDPLATSTRPSSASVFIKYRPDASVAALMSPVKNLVAHSVEGLQYEQVSLTFVAADPTPVAAPAVKASNALVGGFLLAMTGLLICAGALAAWIWRRPESARRALWPMPLLVGWATKWRRPAASVGESAMRTVEPTLEPR